MKNTESSASNLMSKVISLSDATVKLFILSLSAIFLFESLF